MIDSSIGYLPPEAAVDFLCSADPLVYYDALDRLLRHASREQTHILGAYGIEPYRLRSLLLDFPVCSEPAEFTSDWFLVTHNPLDASQLITVLPLKGQALLYMYSQDKGLLAAIRAHRPLEFIGSQGHLLFKDKLKEHRGRSGHPIVRLTEEHAGYCTPYETQQARAYLGLTLKDPGRYSMFGILEKGELLSFCALTTLLNPALQIIEVAYIYTLTSRRGVGYASALLHFVTEVIRGTGAIATYSYDEGNEASSDLAVSVGYELFAKDFTYVVGKKEAELQKDV